MWKWNAAWERARALRLAVLWRGIVIREEMVDEPCRVTVGTDPKADIIVPDGCGAAECEPLPIGDDDHGLLTYGPMAIFYQRVTRERLKKTPLWEQVDSNLLAAKTMAGVLHVAAILLALFLWQEEDTTKKKSWVFAPQVGIEMIVFEDAKPEAVEETDEPLDLDIVEGETASAPEKAPATEKLAKAPGRERGPSHLDRSRSRTQKAERRGLLVAFDQLGGKSRAFSAFSQGTQGLDNKIATAMNKAADGGLVGGGLAFEGRRGGGGPGGSGTCLIEPCGHGDGLGEGIWGSPGTKVGIRLAKKPTRRVKKYNPAGVGRTTSGCKQSDIMRVVRRRGSSFRMCYESRLSSGLTRSGRVTARWTIGLDGRVSTAAITTDGVGDARLKSCLLHTIRRMKFTKPAGATCVVKWPFVFSGPK